MIWLFLRFEIKKTDTKEDWHYLKQVNPRVLLSFVGKWTWVVCQKSPSYFHSEVAVGAFTEVVVFFDLLRTLGVGISNGRDACINGEIVGGKNIWFVKLSRRGNAIIVIQIIFATSCCDWVLSEYKITVFLCIYKIRNITWVSCNFSQTQVGHCCFDQQVGCPFVSPISDL